MLFYAILIHFSSRDLCTVLTSSMRADEDRSLKFCGCMNLLYSFYLWFAAVALCWGEGSDAQINLQVLSLLEGGLLHTSECNKTQSEESKRQPFFTCNELLPSHVDADAAWVWPVSGSKLWLVYPYLILSSGITNKQIYVYIWPFILQTRVCFCFLQIWFCPYLWVW